MRVLEGNVVASNIKIGIVASRFNEFIGKRNGRQYGMMK